MVILSKYSLLNCGYCEILPTFEYLIPNITMSNPQLDLAFNFVENTGVNIFLTGRAGTGKTTFLHKLRERSPKRMVIVAPTGVAAINAGGVTIHSFFQLPFGYFVPDSVRKDGDSRKFNKIKVKIIRSMELLVIDEISMVRADMLDAIDNVLRRYRDKNRPFGGVQLLMIGDLQQLSPVIKGAEWDVLKEYYDTPYFFDSIALKKSQYRNIELTHIYRQRDIHFIDLLAKVRNGDLDSNTLAAINKRYIEGFSPDNNEGYITLTSHNNSAKIINDTKLAQLKREEFSYLATVEGNFPESQYPIEYKLVLKKSAQVMFTRNDPERNFVNGTIGEIISISEDVIEVKISDSTQVIRVEPAIWENIRYSLDAVTKEITEIVEGTFTQYPLKTAWAITIHKSQGLTFDNVVIDAANSFSHGQVYVALSRCRTLEGVVLSSPIRSTSVRKDSTVQSFTNDIEQNPLTEQNLLDDKRFYYHAILIELFDFTQMIINLRYVRRQLDDNLNGLYPKLVIKWSDQVMLFLSEVEDVSLKFKIQIDRLMQNESYETDAVLAERVRKGTVYFKDKLETIITPLLSTLNIEIDNKEVGKSISGGMSRIVDSYKLKIATLNSCVDCFTIKNYLKAKAIILSTEEERKASKSSKRDSSVEKEIKLVVNESDIDDIINGGLFSQLRKWRTQKATELNLPPFMVAHQKVLIGVAAINPTTTKDLGRIKGVGKAFIEKYGVEVLEIVEKYSGSSDKGLFSK